MKQLSKFPNQELLNAQGPFVTIYQEVQLTPPNTEAEQIKFKNQVKNAKTKVKHECEGPTCEALIEQLDSVPNDKGFWSVHRGAVAFFFTPNETYYYRLNTPIQDYMEFGERPILLPMIEEFQFIENYYLLCLTTTEFRLYQGVLKQIERVDLPEDAPDTIKKALGDQLTDDTLFTGGGSGSGRLNVSGSMEKSEEKEIDQENYFRAVDAYVWEHYSRSSQLPLIIFSLGENQSVFRAVTKNRYLSKEKIDASPAQLSDQQIEKEVGKLVDRVWQDRHNAVLSRYRETTPQYKLGDQLQDLVVASMEGRIETLFIEKNIEIKGSIDENGKLDYSGEHNLLNEIALSVMQKNGKVYVLEKAQMPDLKDVAAILRY